MNALSLAAVHYTYPDTTARSLDAIDVELEAGVVLLTGASGSGKSTLLRLCNGLIPHFHGGIIGGRARVFGREVTCTPTRELARDTGFVFQDPELQAVYAKVEHDVAFGLENMRVPRSEMVRRVDAALEACGISSLRNRAVAGLSGGERQRLALAGVLAMRPRLLALDEPLSQLDARGAAALMAALDSAVGAGTTVLVAEQRLAMIAERAGRVLVLDDGHLIEPGAAQRSDRQRVRHSEGRGCDVRSQVAHGGWQLHRVTAGHHGTPVLHDVDIQAGAGEVVALVGDNGSGKTTLLRTIAGLLAPLAGTVERTPGRIAYLPQNPAALLHRRSVRSEVEWTLRHDRSGGDVDGVLRQFDLEAVSDRDPRDLSTGQRQRAALAAVLAGTPTVALLDEPTRGMDPAARALLIGAIARLAGRGGATVLATHDSELVAAVATRVIDLRAGTARETASRAAVTA